MILMGWDSLIFLEPFWPGRVDPMGLVFGLGLVSEEANILPNSKNKINIQKYNH
jgi:hypothetical protein